MGLRERRYAYRDFITPKQTRKKVGTFTFLQLAVPFVCPFFRSAIVTMIFHELFEQFW